LDSLEHAKKFAEKGGDVRQFFLQVNCEESAEHRGGVQISEIEGFLDQSPVAITGLMVVPPLHSQPREIFRTIAAIGKMNGLSCLSMGMSGDFEVAIEEGATHIRIGSSILGSRLPLA
jgi:uncharacterized pyridoxal phosphate-containing UPF0001 family protein